MNQSSTNFLKFPHRFYFSIPKLLVCSLSVPIILPFVFKRINVLRHKKQESKFQDFISSLDAFEISIKKNKIFLQETNLMKSAAVALEKFDKKNNFIQNLVTSIKNVIDLLYIFVKSLEDLKVDERFEVLYEPIEDLNHCELVTNSLENTNIQLKTVKVSSNFNDNNLFQPSLDSYLAFQNLFFINA